MDKVNKDTGLTPLQEKAVALIVNGKSYTDCLTSATSGTRVV